VKKIVFVLCLLQAPAYAQFGQQEDVLGLHPIISVDKVRPGDSFKAGVEVTLLGKWHINSHAPLEEFLIPTAVIFDTIPEIRQREIHYPEAALRKFEFSETKLSVYDGTVVFWAEFLASENISPGDTLRLSGEFSYQACNDVSCLIPTSKPFELTVSIAAKNTAVNKDNEALFVAGTKLGLLQGVRGDSENDIDRMMHGRGVTLTLGFIFLMGLALNLTPCIYPIIPITVGFFVGQSSGSLARSFFLALIYVVGMSITYSALGVFAAMTGGLLGATLQNPAVLVGISAIFLIFAASMFGAFEIRVPAFLNQLAGGSRQGIIGSLLMGLTVGIVAAPCIGPFVLSLLTYVAAKGDPLTGFVLFFVLSLGLGLPYLFLGTFSGSARKLPKSGEWMVWVKHVFGVVMIAVAVYFVSTLLPETLYVTVFTVVLVAGGTLVGFADKSKATFDWFRFIKPIVGFGLITFGAWTAFAAWQDANKPQIAWQQYDDALFAQAVSSDQPILIDFYAEWCIPCKQIDKGLFSEEKVVRHAESFLALKADLTDEKSEKITELRKKYNVLGVPTIILYDTSGREYQRFTDELVKMDSDNFVEILKEAYSTNGSY
jgi:thiol:disulfide interchange protein DsbD